jgi:transposase
LRKKPPTLDVYRRVQAIHLSGQRLKAQEIAEIVSRSPLTVTRWIHEFDARGLPSLWPGKSTGRPPKADADFQAALGQAVDRNPRDLGYAFTRWTVDLLAEHMRRSVHVAVSSSTVRNVLKRLGYRYGRPKLDLKHRQDPKQVARAKRQKARALKKREPVKVVWRFSTVTRPSSTSTPASVAAGLGVVAE